MAIEIVDLPMNSMVIFHSFVVCLQEGRCKCVQIYEWRTKLLTTRNGHGQSGWSPINTIGCEGLYFHAIVCVKIGYRYVGGPLSVVKVSTQM